MYLYIPGLCANLYLSEDRMRKCLGRCGTALLFLALFTMATPQKANAYVDPGTGSMLWQVAAATMIGSLFYVRRVAGWIRQQLGQRSTRVMGLMFASVYALAASPLIVQ